MERVFASPWLPCWDFSSAASARCQQPLPGVRLCFSVSKTASKNQEQSLTPSLHGELEEEVLLAADALQVVQQLAVHPAFGPRADLVDGLGQEVNQVVGRLAATEMHEGREPREVSRFGVSAQLVGGLDRDAPSVPLLFLGKHLVEQVGGLLDPADQLQPRQLGLDAGKARPTRVATQLEKEAGAVPGCPSPSEPLSASLSGCNKASRRSRVSCVRRARMRAKSRSSWARIAARTIRSTRSADGGSIASSRQRSSSRLTR